MKWLVFVLNRVRIWRYSASSAQVSSQTNLSNALQYYIVLPLFNYCSSVWYSCGIGSKAYLDKLNRRAACIIEGRSIEAEELQSTLGGPSLQARRRNYRKCVLVHKYLHGIAPSYLLSEFRHAYLFHGYNTRSRDLLPPPFAKTTKLRDKSARRSSWKNTIKSWKWRNARS